MPALHRALGLPIVRRNKDRMARILSILGRPRKVIHDIDDVQRQA
jgi:hypothetical protein